jgi:hypothetical protein
MSNYSKYPLGNMEVGESFVAIGVGCNTVRASVAQFRRRHPERKFGVTWCAQGSLVTRKPDVEPDSDGDFKAYVISSDGAVIYYGPTSYRTAHEALAALRASGVDLKEPVVAQAPAGTLPDGYLNDWIAPALEAR